ncbi:S-adenosyl-L-methionine-dependent methyltransferase [Cryphonectria parasitica EP155]|uniref:S-adenosyl-L-methionine-dependent methyltransferase n=1 Tax=Cryphonectria parasitica (strain ATCC 38755 / EP155) TaxID=660469 RepID=A0A9P5CK88_CRYP1|nr:S-adenosyl-L-methionine-dependent methyltransferase [Cryphonectria parasitica EP155]KAF3760701.1 S-adenosyl-L-methionine-dependent methyltransferase [Cryphonectria parasitica EP155]
MAETTDNNVSVLTATRTIDDVAVQSLIRPNQRRDDAIRNTSAAGMPAINISPLQGQYLAIQAQLIGAKTVLEIGTLGGYSTLWLAEQAGCKVTSIELDPKHRDVALENVKGIPRGEVEVILGSALDVMPRLLEEGRVFDMIFIDADWEEQWEYFDLAVKLTRKKGCIYVDNVVREMREKIDEGKDLEKVAMAVKVGKDERVTATLIQTASSHKDYSDFIVDGFMLAIVN